MTGSTRRAPWSLSRRLVVGIVVLLAVLATAIGAVTVAASHGQLVARLDRTLLAASDRTTDAVEGRTEPGPIGELLPGQGAGAVVLVSFDGEPVRAGFIGTEGDARSFTSAQVAVLAAVPPDREPRTVPLGPLGDYRVVATPLGGGLVVVNGLSLAEANTTTATLVVTIGAVSIAAIVLAALLGAIVVRIALRPLTRVVDTASRVSQLPLESGAVSMPERVPEADTAPSTEVGRVGAALNALLGKVETSLAARYESEQKLRRFVADASHELRTPLAAIRGYAELGARPAELPADTARSLERIESESTRMGTLVEDMLLLARLDAGRDLRFGTVPLGGLLVEALADAHAAGPDHRWHLDLPDGDVEVPGDRDRLRQALDNLLANARIHTPAGTDVTLALDRDGDAARITVTDDGPGIEPALVPALFERFTRGDDSRSRAAGSTGLGLAIVAAIVEAHGGAVHAASEPGRTVFAIHLPGAAPSDPGNVAG